MRKRMQIILCFLVCGIISSCMHTSATLHAIPVPDAFTKVVSNPNFKAVDNESFSDAYLYYRGGLPDLYHRVPVGDYLLSKLVTTLPIDAEITLIRLNSFESKCGESRAFLPGLQCRTHCSVQIVSNGTVHAINASSQDDDLGSHLIYGEIGDVETLMQDQAKRAIDSLVLKLADLFHSAVQPRLDPI